MNTKSKFRRPFVTAAAAIALTLGTFTVAAPSASAFPFGKHRFGGHGHCAPVYKVRTVEVCRHRHFEWRQQRCGYRYQVWLHGDHLPRHLLQRHLEDLQGHPVELSERIKSLKTPPPNGARCFARDIGRSVFANRQSRPPLFRAHVVAEQYPLVAKIEFAVRHDRMRPCLPLASVRLIEATDLPRSPPVWP